MLLVLILSGLGHDLVSVNVVLTTALLNTVKRVYILVFPSLGVNCGAEQRPGPAPVPLSTLYPAVAPQEPHHLRLFYSEKFPS